MPAPIGSRVTSSEKASTSGDNSLDVTPALMEMVNKMVTEAVGRQLNGDGRKEIGERDRYSIPVVRIGGRSTPAENTGNITPTAVPSPFAKHFKAKLELTTFHEGVGEFVRFEQQFARYVESTYPDDQTRYALLDQYCGGRAKVLVESCDDASDGEKYKTAMSLLRDVFGQDHMRAAVALNELLASIKGSYESAAALTDLAARMKKALITLAHTEHAGDLDTTVTLKRIVNALPFELRDRWGRKTAKRHRVGERASFRDLCKFVAEEAEIRRGLFGPSRQAEDNTRREVRPVPGMVHKNTGRPYNTYGQTRSGGCPVCRSTHQTEDCPEFLKLSAIDRKKKARVLGLCFRCLDQGHLSTTCETSRRCETEGCERDHHSLLHFNERKNTLGSCMATTHRTKLVHLGVLPVRVQGPRGRETVYALLDNGSDISLIEGDLAKRIGLSGSKTKLNLSTISGTSNEQSECYRLKLLSPNGAGAVTIDQLFSVRSLNLGQPVHATESAALRWKHLAGVKFNTHPEKKIRMLIGADVPEAHHPLDQRIGSKGEPFAVQTVLGWILLGPVGPSSNAPPRVNHTRSESTIKEHIQQLYDTDFRDTEDQGTGHSAEDREFL